MTINNKLEFDLPCWQKHSSQAKSLIGRLLEKDPKVRIKLDEALNHEWFKGLDLNNETGLMKNKNSQSSFITKRNLIPSSNNVS